MAYSDAVQACPNDGEGLLPDEAFAGADQDLQLGVTVGEYVVDEKLGEGGFGAVFRATHPLIGKQVAIKVLFRQYSSNPQMVSRFISEARAVNQIRHRNIIDIFSFGQVPDGRHYYVMEYLQGRTLDEYLAERGRLTLAEAIPILRALARALDAAHAKGIAHRDLKPENVFLAVDDDGSPYPKLLDFGIAKLLSTDAPHQHKTRTGAPMGTPYYMSPEQCRGRDVDHRTDYYSFGIVAYQILTGTLPFDGPDFMEILLKQLSEQPVPASQLAPLPASVDQALAWMMQKDPGKRPPNLVTAVRALEEGAAEVGVDVPTPSTSQFAKQTAPGDRRTPLTSGMKTPSGRTPPPGALGRATPGDPGLMATMAADQAPVSQVYDAQPRKGKGGLIFGAAALVAVAGGVAVFMMTRGGNTSAAPDPKAVAQATIPDTGPRPEATPRPEGQPPKPEVVAEPPVAPLPSTVTIEISGPPDGTEVSIGDKEIGVAPGKIELARGDEAVMLTFKKSGYKPREQTITPAKDGFISVELTKDRKRPDKKDPKKDDKDSIEDPFK